VESFRVLDTAEDKISNVEGAFLDVAIVVASARGLAYLVRV
jgi:hypothetical protein